MTTKACGPIPYAARTGSHTTVKRHSFLAILLAVMLTAGACAAAHGGGLIYTDPEDRFLLELPPGWNLYSLDELTTLGALPFNSSFQGLDLPTLAAVAFDASPLRDVANLGVALTEANYPLGAASVRTVSEEARDFVSRVLLTQSVVPYRAAPNYQELTKEDFSFGDGYDGVRVLVAYTGETGAQVAVVYLIAVTDPEDRRLYSIAAGCSRSCFVENQDEIVRVVDSWLVNTRG